MSEARDRIIWLHDKLHISFVQIANHLNISRYSVMKIHKGEYGYSGKNVLSQLQNIVFEHEGRQYTYPNIPLYRKLYKPVYNHVTRCYFCGLQGYCATPTLTGTDAKVETCFNCYARLAPIGKFEQYVYESQH